MFASWPSLMPLAACSGRFYGTRRYNPRPAPTRQTEASALRVGASSRRSQCRRGLAELVPPNISFGSLAVSLEALDDGGVGHAAALAPPLTFVLVRSAPLSLAQALATGDMLCGGRLTVGIGVISFGVENIP